MRREVFTGGGYRSNFWNGVIDWACSTPIWTPIWQLLHLNQAGVQNLISYLTLTHNPVRSEMATRVRTTYIECYKIVLNIRDDRHLYGNLKKSYVCVVLSMHLLQDR